MEDQTAAAAAAESAEKEMSVLEGSPITINLCGKKIEVKRMTIKTERQALKMIQGLAESKDKADPVEKTFDMMIDLVAMATGISVDEITEKSQSAEVAEGFLEIWKQNRFDFLLKTIGRLGAELNG